MAADSSDSVLDLNALGEGVNGLDDAAIREYVDGHGGEDLLHSLMQSMQRSFNPAIAGDARAVICYRLTQEGRPSAAYLLSVADGKCALSRDEGQPPTVTLEMLVPDFVRMNVGQLNMVSAFLKRRIKIKGDLKTARTLGKWFGA